MNNNTTSFDDYTTGLNSFFSDASDKSIDEEQEAALDPLDVLLDAEEKLRRLKLLSRPSHAPSSESMVHARAVVANLACRADFLEIDELNVSMEFLPNRFNKDRAGSTAVRFLTPAQMFNRGEKRLGQVLYAVERDWLDSQTKQFLDRYHIDVLWSHDLIKRLITIRSKAVEDYQSAGYLELAYLNLVNSTMKNMVANDAFTKVSAVYFDRAKDFYTANFWPQSQLLTKRGAGSSYEPTTFASLLAAKRNVDSEASEGPTINEASPYSF